MRRLRFIPALLLILNACSENIIEQNPADSDKMGSVSIALSADKHTEDAATKAAADEPVLDDFIIEIYRTENQNLCYSDSYADTERKQIDLPYGAYLLKAYYGEATGYGFGKPYYLAEKEFEVKGSGSLVTAVAQLANVRLAVEFDHSKLSAVYDDYYAVVHHSNNAEMQVKFLSTETAYGYIPSGSLFLEICTLSGEEWSSHKMDPEVYNSNDFVTFKITTDATPVTPSDEGNLLININVTNDVESVDHTVEIPAWAEDIAAPSITLSGFDTSSNTYEIVEGITSTNAKATFIARGGLSSVVLKIASTYLSDLGVPSEVDFTDLTLDEKNALIDAGFDWTDNMYGADSFAEIDFTGVIKKMQSELKAFAQDVTIAEFFLEVKDSQAANALASFKIGFATVQPVLSLEDYNVWATKIVSPSVTINKGNMGLLKLQTSTDKVSWSDVTAVPVENGNTLTYRSVPLNPSTDYHLRAIYNGNESCVSAVKTIRTEDAAQVGNGGFEEWTEKSYTYDQTIFDKNNNFPWYQPWTSDQWWDTNATNSMKDDIIAAYTYFRLFPAVQYSVDAKSGGKSAQLVVVNVGGANSVAPGTGTNGTWHVGELFLGRGNDADNGGWDKVSEGHAFQSRPTAVSFWYEYVPYTSSDQFGFDVTVKAADGTVLGTKSFTGGSASEWRQAVVEIPYSVVNKKAASIYLNFKASVSSSHDCKVGGEYLEVAGKKPEGDAARIKLSATLRVDDVQLVY